MPIQANVTNNQIMASVGETQIDVSVSGGVGPTGTSGAAATVAVGTVTTGAPGSSASVVNAGSSSAAVLNFTIPAGATGATGAQGPAGPAGTTTWAGITDKPSTFAPSAHKSTHATGGADALTPADIGASAVGHAHAVSQVSGLQASLDAKYPHGNTAAYGGLRGPLAVGTTGRPSYYGTYDQHGNVEEWIQSYGGDGRDNSALFMMRGGSYLADGFGGSFPITYVWVNNPSTSRFENIGFRVATLTDPNGYGGFVDVGDVGNANVQSTSFGGVAYAYKMGRYTVTNEQYCAFLNAVAATDTNALYSASMGSHASGGISRSGSAGSYTYTVLANMGQKPVNFVRWHDAARYCNWLHNGKPTGAQGNATTEDGAYTISSTTTVLLPNSGAKYTLPTESEWIKAGRYKGGSTNAGYWTFATQSDTYPDKIATDLLGSGLPLVALSGSAADLTGTLSAASLPATAVTAGSYGSASSVATFTVDAAGRLTAAGSTAIAISAGAVSGLATVATSGSYTDLTNKPTIPSAYTLPTASASVLGGVKIGSGLSIDGSSVLSATYSYTLPAATTSTLGGVIVGAGLSVTSGTVSANVTSVAGRTGAVVIAAADVSGLGTLATQSSVAYSSLTGTPSTFAPAAHNQAWSTITSTPTSLSGYGITDAVTTSDSRLSDSRTPLSHTHGNITNAGAIGSTSGLPLITTTGGVITVGAFGTTSGTFCQGNDSRLSDSRTPSGAAGGDLTGIFPNPTLAASGVTAGTYTSVTVDAKGRVTAGTNPSGGVKLGLILALQ